VRPLVVGFDLDMTLIDSRPGIAATLDAIAARTGVHIDSAAAVSRLGPPLELELAHWYPADEIDAAADLFRALYADLAIEPTHALTGAAAAVDAVHRHGGRVVVVTGKWATSARLHLDHLGMAADDVVGWRWGPAKGETLREHGASVYVGDHIADVTGARVADAVSVAVATGPCSADELRRADADVVMDDLTGFPEWLDEYVLNERLIDLDESLKKLGSVLVAFSGGADSAFLLAAAVRALGRDRVVAATAVSASLPAAELSRAAAFARDLGVQHLTPPTDELAREGYRANAGDRCWHCKAELLEVLRPLAAAHRLDAIATGTNADDAVAGFRPGIRAAAERGATTPLLDARLSKAQVREASKRWRLQTWDKPAAACLSSRVAYGVPISSARLVRIDRAESALRSALADAGIAVTDLRVRDLGELARIEVDAAAVPEVAALPAAASAVRSAGFSDVEIDPRGFRSGAMNELLDQPDRYR
jgi:pyridinium-3,5-biscarboxylic acid mononucleotide sulfurtransferase